MSPSRVTIDDYCVVMGGESGSPRSIERVGFDRFSFERATDLRDDHATSQLGIDSSGRYVEVGAIAWPEMPTAWLVLSSRRDDDPLELDIEHEPAVSAGVAERFVVDSDDDDLSSLLDHAVSEWLVRTDDDIGPIHVILDGPSDDGDGLPTLFIARTFAANHAADERPRLIDMAELAATARELLRR